ncbi:MAG: putative lipid II flippase FtsW [Actinobacteria bacterium]|nr:putative lipid II flippase FtsW [Actinomycetota bacterium]
MGKVFRLHWMFFACVLALLVIGFLMLLSTSSVVGVANYQNGYYFVKRQSIYLLVGLAAFFVGAWVPNQLYKQYMRWLFFGVLILLGLTLVPGIGVKTGGASRWLNLGFIQFQPVELVKFVVVVVLASVLDHKRAQLHLFWRGLFPILAVMSLPLLMLMMQPDLGNVGLMVLTIGALLWVNRVPRPFLMLLIVAAVLIFVINLFQHPYQMQRVLSFLSPMQDILGRDYHMNQSLIAIGSGGIFGQGIGESRLKYFYLPLQYSDFIFSVICEEGGFVLAGLVVGLFGVLFVRGLGIVNRAATAFSGNLALGLLVFIVGQAFVNMAVVTGLFPVTGIPLTFISFGGTSLMMSLFFIGVIFNVADEGLKQQYQFSFSEEQEEG